MVAQTAACASPEQRYRALSLFFDGVPPPGGAEIALIPGAPELGKKLKGARARLLQPTYVLHEPYAEKECDECHASRDSNRLVASDEELCWTCHDAEDFPGQVVHGPVSAGKCTQCHHPHRSTNSYMLVEAGAALCARCHGEDTFARIEEHRAREGDDCIRCHDPHAEEREYMLRGAERGS